MKKQLLMLTLGITLLGTITMQNTFAIDTFTSSHKPQHPSTATAEDFAAYRQDVNAYVKDINKKIGELRKEKRTVLHEYNQSVRGYNDNSLHPNKLPYYGAMPRGNGDDPRNKTYNGLGYGYGYGYGPDMMIFAPGPVMMNDDEKYDYGPDMMYDGRDGYGPNDCCYDNDRDNRYRDRDRDRDKDRDEDNRITLNSPRYQQR